MYDSRPRPVEGEPIEEVLPAAINATATSAKDESQKASRVTGELARGHESDEETRMAVMRAGLPLGQLSTVPASLLLAGTVLLAVLVILAIVFI